ncbi:GNAT family N-acetyltransferase [Rhodoflexus sp.]
MQTIALIHIRIADAEDAALLAHVGRTSFYSAFIDTSDAADMADYLEKAFNETQIAAELADPDNYFFIMESLQHEVMGYAKLIAGKTHDSLPEGNWWKLHRFYLMPDFIGKGTANLLMNELKDFISQKGAKGMWLATWTENARAIRFYEKNGFVVCGNDRFVMGNSVTCDYVMKWEMKQ